MVLVHVTDDSWLGGRPCTGLLVVRVRRHRVGGKEALSYLGSGKLGTLLGRVLKLMRRMEFVMFT